MNEMRKYIDLVESSNDIIQDELPKYEAKRLAAVRLDGWRIEYINNPSEEVQLAAVRQSGSVIHLILAKGIVPSIAVQQAAVLQNPVSALGTMIYHHLPVSKMIQWTAAKEIKKRNLKIEEIILSKLDPDVQEYLKSK